MYKLNIFRIHFPFSCLCVFISQKKQKTKNKKKMLENISKINYLCDAKEVWSNFVIIYVLMGFYYYYYYYYY